MEEERTNGRKERKARRARRMEKRKKRRVEEKERGDCRAKEQEPKKERRERERERKRECIKIRGTELKRKVCLCLRKWSRVRARNTWSLQGGNRAEYEEVEK